MTPEDTARELLQQAAKAEVDALMVVSIAASRLKKCPETIRRYIRSGRLRAERPPGDKRLGNYLIRESAIANFLATSCDS